MSRGRVRLSTTTVFLLAAAAAAAVGCCSARDVQTFAVTAVAYFDVEIAGDELGRVEIGLFGEIVPRTVANFVAILTDGIDGRTYAGTRFHKVLNKFIVQGGDIVNNDGTGSASIYGDAFADEDTTVNCTKPGFVGMANSGADTNGCQFFITTRPTPGLNGQHVIFGVVTDGQKYVHVIERQPADHLGRPTREIRIKRCGLLDAGRPLPYHVTDSPRDLDVWKWINASALPISMSTAILLLFQWMIYQINKAIV